MILTSGDKYREKGLLAMRTCLGILYIFHGYPKISGGYERWEGLGKAMENLGITFMPVFWGFMAAFAEFFGGILLILGLFFRPTCGLLFITMAVATLRHISGGDAFSAIAHPLKMAVVFFSLILIGPGIYSFDEKLKTRFTKKEKEV